MLVVSNKRDWRWATAFIKERHHRMPFFHLKTEAALYHRSRDYPTTTSDTTGRRLCSRSDRAFHPSKCAGSPDRPLPYSDRKALAGPFSGFLPTRCLFWCLPQHTWLEMSGWGMGWFGGGQAKKKNAPKEAILKLRTTLEILNKREKHLQNQIDEQDAIARKTVNTNKAGKAQLRRTIARSWKWHADRMLQTQLPKPHCGGKRPLNTPSSKPKLRCSR